MGNLNQSTALAKSERALPIATMADLATAGQLIAQSGILGAKNPAEGFLIAATCHQTGMSYLEFGQRFHLFHGKISDRADAMLADANRNGWRHRIIDRTPERACVELSKEKEKYIFEFTWDQALQEPFIYRGNPSEQMAELQKPIEKRRLKDKYATPRSRLQMLWARVTSDAVRAVDPCANHGLYTPEEIEDMEYESAASATSEPIPVSDVTARISAMRSANPEPATAEPESEPEPQTQTPPAAPEPTPFDNFNKDCDAIQFGTCPIPDCDMTGKAWSDMPTKILKLAYTVKHPTMEPGHYAAIVQLVSERESNGKSAN